MKILIGDLNLSQEILVETNVLDGIFKLKKVVHLFELDYKPVPFNFLDLSRRLKGITTNSNNRRGTESNGDAASISRRHGRIEGTLPLKTLEL